MMKKIVVLYLMPYWYFWCVGLLVQDKVYRTNYRNFIPINIGRSYRGFLLALVALLPMMTYGLFIPITLIYLLPESYRYPLSMLYIILFIIMMLFLAVKHKSLEPYFKKPKFLDF